MTGPATGSASRCSSRALSTRTRTARLLQRGRLHAAARRVGAPCESPSRRATPPSSRVLAQKHVRRADADPALLRPRVLLSMPAWVVMAVYLVNDAPLVAAAARADGDGDGGGDLPVRDADRRRRRHLQPAAVADRRLPRHGRRDRCSSASADRPAVDHRRSGRSGALGYTFTSGAYQAWITDEVGVERVGARLPARRADQLRRRARRARSCRSGSASLAAGGGDRRRRGSCACGLACIFVMPETGFRRRPRDERGSRCASCARPPPPAPATCAAAADPAAARRQLFVGMSSEAFDRLWEAHFIRDVGLPAIGRSIRSSGSGSSRSPRWCSRSSATGWLMKRFERRGRRRRASCSSRSRPWRWSRSSRSGSPDRLARVRRAAGSTASRERSPGRST